MVEHVGAKETALFVRARLDHELVLLNQRMTWMVMSNSFLFTAFAVSLGATTGRSSAYEPVAEALVRLLPLSAIASLVSYYVSAAAGLFAMTRLHRFMKVGDDEVLSTALVGGRIQRMSGLAAPLVLPIIFLVTWVALLRLL